MDRLARAAAALGRGGLVAYPTDTLFGLGARAGDAVAVDRLLALKGRPAGQPISVAVSSTEEVEPLAVLSPAARAFVRTHLPGPYTVIAASSPWARRHLAPALLAEDGTIGLRVPDHPVARELARRAGPVTATSLNRHGEAPPATLAGARRRLGAGVSVYLAGGPRPSGRPSTLVDLTGPAPRERARRP